MLLFCQKAFLGIRLHHTNIQYVYIAFAKYQIASVKALARVDFPVDALYGLRQANLVLIAYASSKGSGEPAHPRSLARTSAARSYK